MYFDLLYCFDFYVNIYISSCIFCCLVGQFKNGCFNNILLICPRELAHDICKVRDSNSDHHKKTNNIPLC